MPTTSTFSNRVPGYSTASKGEKCHFWAYLVFYQVPTTSTFSNQVPGYSMASKGEKCHFWAYLVFHQVPTTSTFSNQVPGYSTVSKGEKCHFWVYLVFYQVPTTSTFSNQVPGYSTVSKGEKCCFWAYLVFYQVPTISTLKIINISLFFAIFHFYNKKFKWLISTKIAKITHINSLSKFQQFIVFMMLNEISQYHVTDFESGKSVLWITYALDLDK